MRAVVGNILWRNPGPSMDSMVTETGASGIADVIVGRYLVGVEEGKIRRQPVERGLSGTLT
jgi:hypothetical protein